MDDCIEIIGGRAAVESDMLFEYRGILQTPERGNLTPDLVTRSVNECGISGYDPPQLMCRKNGVIFTGLNSDAGLGKLCNVQPGDDIFAQLPLFDSSSGSTPGVTDIANDTQITKQKSPTIKALLGIGLLVIILIFLYKQSRGRIK